MQSCQKLTRLPLFVLCLNVIFVSLQAGADSIAYVANTSDNVVTVIDTTTDALLATIPVGASPTQVAVSQDGARTYVTNTGSDSLSVIDTATNAVVATVAVANAPSAVAVTPDGAEVYVLASGGVLQVIDAELIGTPNDPMIATISLGTPGVNQHGTSIAFLSNGTRAYVVTAGLLWVIDTASLTVESSLDVGSSPSHLALSQDGTRAYITNPIGSVEFGLGGQVVGLGGHVTLVDTLTNSVLGTISLFSAVPGSIAVTPDGSRAYVASVSRFLNSGYGMGFVEDKQVAVIDLTTNTLSGWIPVAGTPAGLASTSDGSLIYVAVPRVDLISVIDTETDTLATTIAVAAGPNGLAIASSQPAPDSVGIAVSLVPEPAPALLQLAALLALTGWRRLRI